MNTKGKKEQFLASFESQKLTTNNPRISQLIAQLDRDLESLDFPTSKSEKWKYTRVGKLVKNSFSPSEDQIDLSSMDFAVQDLDAWTLVFENGVLNKNASQFPDAKGLKVSSLKERIESDESPFATIANSESEIFTAINTLYQTGGVSIEVEKNKQIEKPIHLVFINSGEATIQQPRNLIQLGSSSEMDVIMTFISSGSEKSFMNHVTELSVENNAKLNLSILERMNEESFLINEINGVQHDDATCTINTFTANGGWTRNNIRMDVKGKNGLTNLYGAYIPKGNEHIDNHTVIDHLVPHCESNELYKGIVHDQSTAIFNGKVFVREDAQKTNAYQQNANILLSDSATVNSKPELEIYADDVKCSHGSTIGQFDEKALFYLKSRGIAEMKAKKMLVGAFVSEVIDFVENEALREHVYHIMNIK